MGNFIKWFIEKRLIPWARQYLFIEHNLFDAYISNKSIYEPKLFKKLSSGLERVYPPPSSISVFTEVSPSPSL